jgi:hypothetical protein
VDVLVAQLAAGSDARWPVDHERIADAAAVGLPLPPPERGVAGPRPAPRIVVEVPRAAELVDRDEVLLERLGHEVEEQVLVDRAGRSALGARAGVGDQHDQRVVELAELLEEGDQAADVVVGVLEEAGEDLHHAGVQTALVVGQRVPGRDVRIPLGQDRIGVA